MNHLSEGQFGHGAVRQPILHKIRRFFRPKIAMADVPFDWNNIPPVKDLKIKNQFQSFSCGGQAGAYLLEILTGQEISAKSIYAPVHASGGGMTLSVLENKLAYSGAVLEARVPSYLLDGTTNETFMTEMSWNTPELTRDALTRSGYTLKSVPIDIDSIAQATVTYGGVILLLDGQNNGTWLTPFPAPPSRNNFNPLWGHYMCTKTPVIMNEKKNISSYQSWGDNVGKKGIQYFNETYINSGYIIDAFVLVKKPVTLIFNTPVITPMVSLPKESWWRKLMALLTNIKL